MRKSLLTAALLAAAAPVYAHEGGQGPNGGRVAEAGAYHVELVAKDKVIEAFVSDANEKPLPPTGFKGTALLVVDGKPQRIPLSPEGQRLTGKADVALPISPKGAVQLTSPDGKTTSARFN